MSNAQEDLEKYYRLFEIVKAKKEVNEIASAEVCFRQMLPIARRHTESDPSPHYICLCEYGELLMADGRSDEAVTLLKEAVQVAKERFADKPYLEAKALMGLADAYAVGGNPAIAAELLIIAAEKYVESWNSTGETRDRELQAECLGQAALLQLRAENLSHSRLLMDQAITLANALEDPRETLAMLLFWDFYISTDEGNHDRALQSASKSLALSRRLLGENDPFNLDILRCVAIATSHCGDSDEAERLINQVLEKQRRFFGNESEAEIETLGELAAILLEGRNQPKEAASVLEDALQMAKQVFGSDHTACTRFRDKLVDIYDRLGDTGKIVLLREEQVDIVKNQSSGELFSIVDALLQLGEAYQNNQEPRKAMVPFRESIGILNDAIDGSQENNEEINLKLAVVRANLTRTYLDAGLLEEGEAQARIVMEDLAPQLKDNHDIKLICESLKALLLIHRNRHEEAFDIMETLLPELKNVSADNIDGKIGVYIGLASKYSANGDSAKAKELLEELLTDVIQIKGSDHIEVKEIRQILEKLCCGANLAITPTPDANQNKPTGVRLQPDEKSDPLAALAGYIAAALPTGLHFDSRIFLEFFRNSISLTRVEKERILENLRKLDFQQITGLYEIFKTEHLKMLELEKEKPENKAQLAELRSFHEKDWDEIVRKLFPDLIKKDIPPPLESQSKVVKEIIRDHMDSIEKIDELDKKGMALAEEGRFHESKQCLLHSLEMKRKLYKHDDSSLAKALYRMGELFLEWESPWEALQFLDDAEKIVIDSDNLSSEYLYIDILQKKASVALERDNPHEALQLAKKAEEQYREAFEKENIRWAYGAIFTAEVALKAGEYGEAVECAWRAIDILKRNNPDEYDQFAYCWLIAARGLTLLGDREKAWHAFLSYARFSLDDNNTGPMELDGPTLIRGFLSKEYETYEDIIAQYIQIEAPQILANLLLEQINLTLHKPVHELNAEEVELTLVNGTILLMQISMPETASQIITDGLNLYRDLFGENHEAMVTLLYMAGKATLENQEFDRAIGFIREAIELDKLTKTKDNQSTSNRTMRITLGDIYRQTGRFDEAIEIFSGLIDETADDTPEERTRLFNLMRIKAEMNEKKGDIVSARITLEQALAKDSNGSSEQVAEVLKTLSKLCMKLGYHSSAVVYGKQALATYRRLRGDNHLDVATAIHDLANIYKSQHDYAACLVLLKEGLEIRRRISPNSVVTLFGIEDLCLVYELLLKDPGRSWNLLSEGLELNKQIFGDQSFEVAEHLERIGKWYLRTGDYEKAEEFLHQSLTMIKNNLGADHPAFLDNLQGFADLYIEKREYGKAIDIMEKVSNTMQQGSIKDEKTVAEIYISLAIIAIKAFKDHQALEYVNRAMELTRKSSGDFSAKMAGIYRYRAIALARSGSEEDALNDFLRAAFIYSIYENFDSVWVVYRDLGDPLTFISSFNTPQFYSQIYYEKKAINAIEIVRKGTQDLSKDLRTSFLFEQKKMYQNLVSSLIILERFAEAEEVTQILKRDAFWEAIRGTADIPLSTVGLTLAKFEIEAQQIENQVIQCGKTLLAELIQIRRVSCKSSEVEQRIQVLNRELQRTQEEFIETSRQIIKKLYNIFSAGLRNRSDALFPDQLQERPLPENGVRLHYFLSDKILKIVLISDEGMLTREVEISNIDLAKLVHSFRIDLQTNETNPRTEGKKLFDLLLAPVSGELKRMDKQNIEILANGVLQLVPFAALFDGRQYLVEEFNLVRTSDLVLPGMSHQEKDWRICAFGTSKEARGLPGLPHVLTELRNIVFDKKTKRGAFPGTMVLNEHFTKQALFEAVAGKPAIVHVASHFIFNPAEANGSNLLLGSGELLPLHRLIDDCPDFSGIELVTLSACQTGISSGSADRDSLDNLATIILEKGASSVLASLWPVFDESTALIMQSFYFYLQNNKRASKAEALRLAQLDLLHRNTQPLLPGANSRGIGGRSGAITRDYSHPYYWAPFLLMGNWF